MTRREFTSLLAAPAAAAIAPGLHLIAHRGGVVDATRPENSPAAVRTAIEHGYWMLEVDIRRSRDGEPVLYHDNNLSKYFGTSARVEDLTWSELRGLTSKPGGTPPLHFDLLCATCGAANMRLMLDLKGQWEPAFYQQLLRIMTTHKIPQPIWSLGGPRVRPLFDGHVMVSVNRKTLQAALDSGEPVAQRYFLFELGSDLDESAIQLAVRNKVTPTAAINTFRYTMAKRDEWEGPKEDIARLRSLGLRHYQVDSRYESLFS
ncbi:MAG: hypothetical protein JNN08_01235 [Bryobacterales bacterium]|nr:hypothetical protein [Bryobacterales bacterium]